MSIFSLRAQLGGVSWSIARSDDGGHPRYIGRWSPASIVVCVPDDLAASPPPIERRPRAQHHVALLFDDGDLVDVAGGAAIDHAVPQRAEPLRCASDGAGGGLVGAILFVHDSLSISISVQSMRSSKPRERSTT